jgi:hypothetical protein
MEYALFCPMVGAIEAGSMGGVSLNVLLTCSLQTSAHVAHWGPNTHLLEERRLARIIEAHDQY